MPDTEHIESLLTPEEYAEAVERVRSMVWNPEAGDADPLLVLCRRIEAYERAEAENRPPSPIDPGWASGATVI